MSTTLAQNVQNESHKNIEETKLSINNGFIKAVKVLATLGIAGYLFGISFKYAVVFILAIGFWISKNAFIEAFDIFQLDFDLTKDIFRDLEPF